VPAGAIIATANRQPPKKSLKLRDIVFKANNFLKSKFSQPATMNQAA
jgi:hypothetical protein